MEIQKFWGLDVKLKSLVCENFGFPPKSTVKDIGSGMLLGKMHQPMPGGWCYLTHILVLGEENFETALKFIQFLLFRVRRPPHFVHHGGDLRVAL
jgi:hypothetical protein